MAIAKVSSLIHPLKALPSIDETFSGIKIDVRPVQLTKV